MYIFIYMEGTSMDAYSPGASSKRSQIARKRAGVRGGSA